MEIILDLLYIYIAIYSIYFLALAIRNINDRSFKIEKRYNEYKNKKHLAIIIYSHNNKNTLEGLIQRLKLQDYPIDSLKVIAILDNCNDGSEIIFNENRFVNVVKFEKTLGKDLAISTVIDQLSNDDWIDAYIFIDGNRIISTDFLSTVNAALVNNSVLSGETLMNTDRLDIIESIKAIYQKYHMNFIRQARSLFGLASQADSGVFVIKKEIIDKIGVVNFKSIDTELKYSLLLSKIGYKCTYNPNIKTFVNSEGYIFKRPRLTQRIKLFIKCIKGLWTTNFVFVEHALSLIYPNFWLVFLSYLLILSISFNHYFFVDFKFVLFTFILWICGFVLSLLNAKLAKSEIILLMFYPVYSIGHIIKNFPGIRNIINKLFNKIGKNEEKFSVDAIVSTGKNDFPCKLEFISDNGISKVRFIFKNKKYTTAGTIRMIDALQDIKSKLDDYGFILKICSCCTFYKPIVDGSTNMISGICNCNFPSPSLKEKETVIWNSCQNFSPAKLNNIIEEIIAKNNEEN